MSNTVSRKRKRSEISPGTGSTEATILSADYVPDTVQKRQSLLVPEGPTENTWVFKNGEYREPPSQKMDRKNLLKDFDGEVILEGGFKRKRTSRKRRTVKNKRRKRRYTN